MTVAELELLRARIPGPVRAQEYAPDVAWWNADREHLLATIAFCKAALARGSTVPPEKAAQIRTACDDLVARAQTLAPQS